MSVVAVVDEPDLGVQAFEFAVGQPEIDRGKDLFAVFADGAGEVDDGGDA